MSDNQSSDNLDNHPMDIVQPMQLDELKASFKLARESID